MPTASTQRARREATRHSDLERRLDMQPGSGLDSRSSSFDATDGAANRRPDLQPTPNGCTTHGRSTNNDPSDICREQLIVHYMGGHVRRIAERMRSTLYDHIEVDDLMQQGYLGLVESIERFQPELGFKFETFSARRISGSMQDWLRSQDHLPRLMRTRHGKWPRPPSDSGSCMATNHRRPSSSSSSGSMKRRSSNASRIGPPMVVTFGSIQSNEEDSASGGMNLLQDSDETSPMESIARGDLQRWVTRDSIRG